MRLTEIRNGMRLTLFSGKGAERKPVLVTVLDKRYVKSNSLRRRQIRILVKPCNGGRRQLVVPRQLQPPEVYDQIRNALAVSKRRAEQLELQRQDCFKALMRHGIVAQQAELLNGGHLFGLQINSRDLKALTKLLRGHDGNSKAQGNEGIEEDTGEEGGSKADDAKTQLQSEVRSVAAGGG